MSRRCVLEFTGKEQDGKKEFRCTRAKCGNSILIAHDDPSTLKMMCRDAYQDMINLWTSAKPKQVRTSPSPPPITSNILHEGPGTELAKIFKSWGVKPCQICQRTAEEMNIAGPEEVLKNISSYVNQIDFNSSKSQSLGMRLARKVTPEKTRQYIIREAIKKACDICIKKTSED